MGRTQHRSGIRGIRNTGPEGATSRPVSLEDTTPWGKGRVMLQSITPSLSLVTRLTSRRRWSPLLLTSCDVGTPCRGRPRLPPEGLDVSKTLVFACPECCQPLCSCLRGLHGRLQEALGRSDTTEGTNENRGKVYDETHMRQH